MKMLINFIFHLFLLGLYETNCLYSPQYMFPYGPAAGDTELAHEYGAYDHVKLAVPITFFGQTNSDIYVDSHGVIWPGWYGGELFDDPTPFPVLSGYQVVACYWADSDLSKNPNSHVYYRVVTDFETVLIANSILKKAYGPAAEFDTTSSKAVIIVATWVNITYDGGSSTTPTNSFQCAMLSDGTNSYTLYSYIQLQWLNSPVELSANNPAIAGVDDGRGNSQYNNFTLPMSHTSSVTNLVSVTNFVQTGIAGWNMLTVAEPYLYQKFNLSGVSYKTCTAVTDPHYTTFDNLAIDSAFGANPGPVTAYQPANNYIVVATSDCHSLYGYLPFSVIMNVGPCSPLPPCSNAVQQTNPCTAMCPNGAKINLYYSNVPPPPNGRPYNDVEIDLFYDHYENSWLTGMTLQNSYSCASDKCPPSYLYYITPTTDGYTLTTDFGLTVTYTGFPTGYLSVTLPTYAGLTGNVFGYCGNLDNIADNDKFCWNPALENYLQYESCWPESYLNNTRTGFGNGIYQCQNYPVDFAKRSALTNSGDTQFPDWAIQRCKVFIDPNGVFSACQSIATTYYTSCLLDMVITNNDYSTFCVDAQQLARSCLAQLNVTSLIWRSASFCPLQCQDNAHYSSYYPSCIATCDDPFAAFFCTLPPTEGCICDDGFVMEGNQCIHPSECGGCLNDNGVLVATGTQWITDDCSRTCVCNGNGKVACTSTPCNANAACVSSPSPLCQCNAGFHGDGYYCSTVDNCSPYNNCQNGATCVTQSDGYKCVCQAGYTNQFCDLMINFCTPNPCANGAVCSPLLNDYNCNCTVGYGGKNCDQQVNWCATFPCMNSGTCVNQHLNYICNCPSQYTGVNCEMDMTTMLPTTPPPTLQSTLQTRLQTTQPTPPPTSPPILRSTTTPPAFNCNGRPDGNYQNPNNPCSQTYYTCANGITYPFICPAGLYFDQEADACEPAGEIPACQ